MFLKVGRLHPGNFPGSFPLLEEKQRVKKRPTRFLNSLS